MLYYFASAGSLLSVLDYFTTASVLVVIPLRHASVVYYARVCCAERVRPFTTRQMAYKCTPAPVTMASMSWIHNFHKFYRYLLMDMTSQGLCSPPGRPDIYGVGVRAAFYTQWLGTLIMEYISESDLSDLRFIGLSSSAAASISLVIGIAHNALTPLDIYFLLLFGIGFFLFLMPLCIWRVITRCQPHLDPFLLTNEVHGTFYYLVALTILMATLSMGTWYYTVFLPHLSRGCRDVVFMLGQVNLESKEYVIVGAVFYIGVLSSIGGFIFLKTCCTPITHSSTRNRRNRYETLPLHQAYKPAKRCQGKNCLAS